MARDQRLQTLRTDGSSQSGRGDGGPLVLRIRSRGRDRRRGLRLVLAGTVIGFGALDLGIPDDERTGVRLVIDLGMGRLKGSEANGERGNGAAGGIPHL